MGQFDIDPEQIAAQQRMANMKPEEISRLISSHDARTLKDMNISQEMQIQIYSGLMATTPIVIGDDVADIYKLFLMHAEGATLGLDLRTGKVVNTHILSIPNELRVDEYCTLEFSSGLQMQCTPSTKILAVGQDGKKDFVSAKNLKNGQTIVGFGVRDNGMSEREFKLINKIDEKNILGIPAYFFICEHENIFIPTAGGVEGDAMSFIVIHQ